MDNLCAVVFLPAFAKTSALRCSFWARSVQRLVSVFNYLLCPRCLGSSPSRNKPCWQLFVVVILEDDGVTELWLFAVLSANGRSVSVRLRKPGSCNTAKKLQHNIAVLLWHRRGSCDTVGVYNTFGLSVSAILQIPGISSGLYTCCGRREICFSCCFWRWRACWVVFFILLRFPRCVWGPTPLMGAPSCLHMHTWTLATWHMAMKTSHNDHMQLAYWFGDVVSHW